MWQPQTHIETEDYIPNRLNLVSSPTANNLKVGILVEDNMS